MQSVIGLLLACYLNGIYHCGAVFSCADVTRSVDFAFCNLQLGGITGINHEWHVFQLWNQSKSKVLTAQCPSADVLTALHIL